MDRWFRRTRVRPIGTRTEYLGVSGGGRKRARAGATRGFVHQGGFAGSISQGSERFRPQRQQPCGQPSGARRSTKVIEMMSNISTKTPSPLEQHRRRTRVQLSASGEAGAAKRIKRALSKED